MKWYRLAAEQSNANAQNTLGVMYINGRGVEQDDQKAAKWLRMAAKQGKGLAQSNLALMYIHGCGLPKSNFNGYMWLYLAKQEGLNKEAKAEFDKLTKIMSSDEISKAEQKAQTCLNSNYKNCG